MGAKLIDITKYQPKRTDIFFFDNNVWMFLFCPLGDYQNAKQKAYSSLLASIKTSNATIFVNSLILSEFANRYLRMDFEQWMKETGNKEAKFKKDYVGLDRYKETVKEVKIGINNILKCSERFTDNFNSINLPNILNNFTHSDFNDSYYIELTNQPNWHLVSDDRDFRNHPGLNIPLVTLI